MVVLFAQLDCLSLGGRKLARGEAVQVPEHLVPAFIARQVDIAGEGFKRAFARTAPPEMDSSTPTPVGAMAGAQGGVGTTASVAPATPPQTSAAGTTQAGRKAGRR